MVLHIVCAVSLARLVKVSGSFMQSLYDCVCPLLALLSKVTTGWEKCYKVICLQFEAKDIRMFVMICTLFFSLLCR
jgi:hypothetical protein